MWRLGSNQQVPSPSLLTRSGEGRGGASRGRSRTPEASSWEGGAEDRDSSATSARGGEGRRKSGPIPSATDSERPPPPPSPRKQTPAQPRTLAALTESRSPVAPALPRPAGRPSGQQSARGRRPGVVRPKPLLRRPPCVATTPGGRRRRGGGGGRGVLLSRPLPSPELAPNVRARWSEAATKVVLPRCAA